MLSGVNMFNNKYDNAAVKAELPNILVEAKGIFIFIVLQSR